jgi:transposase
VAFPEDLNPIENIWPWLKIGAAKKRSKLKTSQDIWNELDRLTDLPEFTELCINCCKFFENRLNECVKIEGFITEY